MTGPSVVHGQIALQREYEIKAAYLYNFINYVDWPEEAFPAPGGTITIGIAGDHPFSSAFEPLNGKEIKGRTLAMKRFTRPEELTGCHIVFIGSSESQRVPEWLNVLNDSRVLTVGEVEGFALHGGVINFISERNKVRFEINPDAARRLGLNISSELLKLARLVK